MTSLRTLFFSALLAVPLYGCDAIGPSALRQSRPDYNQVIQDTSKAQNFLNLVRTREHEPTEFMDVVEVDVSLQLQAALNATANLPHQNAIYPNYTIGGSAAYQENPTIRYAPLIGQALVAQVTTPISVDSIAWLVDSMCPPSCILNLSAVQLSPSQADYYEALDAIIALYNYEALIIRPARADPTSSSTDDCLVLYCTLDRIRTGTNSYTHEVEPALTRQARKLWHVLWTIYASSQPPGITEEDYRIELRTLPKPYPIAVSAVRNSTEIDYQPSSRPTTQPAMAARRDTTETDITGVAGQQFQSLPEENRYELLPVLRTRSAVGILRDVTQPDQDFDLAVFVSAHQFARLKPMVDHFRSQVMVNGLTRDYYVFDSGKFTGLTGEINDTVKPGGAWHVPAAGEPVDDLPENGQESYQDFYEEHDYPERGDRMRHYMIVVYQDVDQPVPPDAYVTAVCDGKRFYIDGNDVVSQRNFCLISNFLAIQSTAQTSLLTPTIGVGGH